MKPINEVLAGQLGPGPIDPYVDPAPEVRAFHSQSRAGTVGQTSVTIPVEDLGTLEYVQMSNYRGDRVWVSPLCHMHGQPVYPPVHLPPGEKRRAEEAKIQERYFKYRQEQSKQRRTTTRRESEDDS